MYLCVEYIQSGNSRAKMPDVAPADNVGIEIKINEAADDERSDARSWFPANTFDSIFTYARAYGWTVFRILK